MSRKFLRPLFSFWEPFSKEPFFSKKVVPEVLKYNGTLRIDQKKEDALETFNNFFKDQFNDPSKLKKEEKEFFEKHFPKNVGRKVNAFAVLGVDEKADIDKINDAYRTKAIKYHPKNDPTPEGQKKFQELSKAYNELMNKKTASDQGEDRKSLFEEFHNKMENINNSDTSQQEIGKTEKSEKQEIVDEKPAEKIEGKEQSQSRTGQKMEDQPQTVKQQKKKFPNHREIYSESSYFEYLDGKKNLQVTKMYGKNGKSLKVDRIEDSLPDGSVEVTETFDDGNEVKQNKFIQLSSRKQIGF